MPKRNRCPICGNNTQVRHTEFDKSWYCTTCERVVMTRLHGFEELADNANYRA